MIYSEACYEIENQKANQNVQLLGSFHVLRLHIQSVATTILVTEDLKLPL